MTVCPQSCHEPEPKRPKSPALSFYSCQTVGILTLGRVVIVCFANIEALMAVCFVFSASESESDQPRKVRQSLLQPVTISPNSVLENKNSTPAPVEKRPGTCGFLACRNHRVATKSATHHIHRCAILISQQTF